MIIASSTDYRAAAQRRLPPFLYHYIDGGAYAEYTLGRNTADLSEIALRQRGPGGQRQQRRAEHRANE